jgi:DNA-binding PadR family transcriptional regulator
VTDVTLLLLTSLADGPKHGYAMQHDIEDFAGVRLGPGTLYGAISRLEDEGLIAPLETEDRRKPYQITQKGRRELQQRVAQLGQIMQQIVNRLNPA